MRKLLFLSLLSLFVFAAYPAQAANSNVSDPASLIAAITTANSNGEADIITLTANITLTAVDNNTNGPNGLPSILADTANSLTIEGNGFRIERSLVAPNLRIFHVAAGATLIINDLTLADGITNGGLQWGGLIHNLGTLTINDSTLMDSSSIAGGAIGTMPNSSLIINGSTITGNDASGLAGGIYVDGASLFEVNDSTFFDNEKLGIGNGGGAIALSNASGTIRNSTFFDNRSGGGSSSGGAVLLTSASITIINSTIVNNPRGGISNNGSSVTLINTILANNSPNCSGFGAYTTNANNIFGFNGNADGCPVGASDIVPAGALTTVLDATLANNGGSTQTLALVAGSPALDAARSGDCSTIDQRGITRGADGDGTPNSPEFGDCDIGAYEASGFVVYDSLPVVASIINLGAVALGDSITTNLDIIEAGIGTLNVSLDSITGTNAADFSIIGLPTSIADGDAAQEIGIVCTPSSVGALTATITFASNDPAQPLVSYDVMCEGLATAIVTNTVTITLPNGDTVAVNAETDYILKTVDKPFATVGDTVTYTIRAHNPKDTPLTQVSIYDVFDKRLVDVQVLSSTHGIASFSENTLTVNDFDLQPNEEALILVSARIASLNIGETIPNAAILESPDASVHVSNLALVGENPFGNFGSAAQVFLIPSQLPNTGEVPFWHNWLMGILLAGVGIILTLAIFPRVRRYKSS